MGKQNGIMNSGICPGIQVVNKKCHKYCNVQQVRKNCYAVRDAILFTEGMQRLSSRYVSFVSTVINSCGSSL